MVRFHRRSRERRLRLARRCRLLVELVAEDLDVFPVGLLYERPGPWRVVVPEVPVRRAILVWERTLDADPLTDRREVPLERLVAPDEVDQRLVRLVQHERGLQLRLLLVDAQVEIAVKAVE